jgi:hypothetical protein
MKILSLDPGFYNFGWVLLDTNDPAYPIYCTSACIGNYGTDTKSRIIELKKLFYELTELITIEDVILIESQFKGHMRHMQIILLTLFSNYPNVHVIHPIHVKKFMKYSSKGYRNNKIESVEAAKKLAPSAFLNGTGRRIHDMADAYMQAIFWACVHGHISNDFVTTNCVNVKTVSTNDNNQPHCTPPPRDAASANEPSRPRKSGWAACAELSDTAA